MGEEAWPAPAPRPLPLVSKYRGSHDLCRDQCPIGLPPWGHPTFHQERTITIPIRHDLIEGVRICMISRQEAQAKFS